MTSDEIGVASEQFHLGPDLKIAYNAPATSDSQASVPRVGRLLGFFVAFVELMLFSALTLGALLGVGALLHHLHPGRHFDVFYALHRTAIAVALAAICAMWLLPPYPWSNRSEKQPRSHLRAGGR